MSFLPAPVLKLSCHSETFAVILSSSLVILSPSLVILSGAKNLALPLRINSARNLALAFPGRYARRRARFLASPGLTAHGFFVPVSRRA
ncbi:exported hypothetical protein [Acidobacteriia bacterium SbA2]|nr:exported hypothetical protein [Acidobacteriia bacterium SbA2]